MHLTIHTALSEPRFLKVYWRGTQRRVGDSRGKLLRIQTPANFLPPELKPKSKLGTRTARKKESQPAG